jgi:DNA-binding CsgD family transcriptional regulator
MRISTLPALATRLSSQLYTINQDITNVEAGIQNIGDYLPGSILINDVSIPQNTYMNKWGCDYLKREREELQAMGPAYLQAFFDPAEISLVLKMTLGMIQLNDTKKVYSYFQRVRPSDHADWKWFYATQQLIPDPTGANSYKVIVMAHDASKLQNSEKALRELCISQPMPEAAYQRFNTLTKREKEILSLIAKGYTNQQISDMLFVAVFTVETHRKKIKQKLEAKTIADLVNYATLFHL